jgi:hypothetical protein
MLYISLFRHYKWHINFKLPDKVNLNSTKTNSLKKVWSDWENKELQGGSKEGWKFLKEEKGTVTHWKDVGDAVGVRGVGIVPIPIDEVTIPKKYLNNFFFFQMIQFSMSTALIKYWDELLVAVETIEDFDGETDKASIIRYRYRPPKWMLGMYKKRDFVFLR